MWYEKSYRRHLCDMHINDWNEEFLSEFSADEYLNNLKKAKIQSAMIYLQSHVGLCYYPTRTAKMHPAFKGREAEILKLVNLCHQNNISVIGYYSLIYNNWAYSNHPEWRMIDKTGKPWFGTNNNADEEFANNSVFRYGLCCPNNKKYRNFVSEQIREIADMFKLEGMFYDMLFWPHFCYCDSCKERWRKEVGGEIPVIENWKDETWLLHMKKRREWMGDFAQAVTKETKELMPNITVEHNFSSAALPNRVRNEAEEVNDACDYVGGDLYGDIYSQSFTCKLYRNITKNQPFEYMFSRCTPTLSKHTVTKSEDEMKSEVYLTSAHHGATLVIDAIDPAGTFDERVYERIGKIFEETSAYEKYFKGDMIEDVGVYYSLKSKFNPEGEPVTNHTCSVNTVETLVKEHIPCGITGGWHDLSKYKILITSMLTSEDEYDNERIAEYVKNGGRLYISGAGNKALLKELLCLEFGGYTDEKITYMAPEECAEKEFCYFNKKYPLHFDLSAPCARSKKGQVLAKITLPYTKQDTPEFASIHSNPPGIKTEIPALIYSQYGRGAVLWSALPIENEKHYDYRRIFVNLIKMIYKSEFTIFSDAPRDIEIVAFKDNNDILVSTVLLNEEYKARKAEDFSISVNCGKPRDVLLLPEKKKIDYIFRDNTVTFDVKNNGIFSMFKLII